MMTRTPVRELKYYSCGAVSVVCILGCLCTFGKSVATSIVNQGSVLQPEVKVQLEKRCDQLYKNIADLKAKCGSVETTEELTTFLDCCLSPLEGVLSTM